ncbi:hypothetical protein V1505DRAFT_358065 [Lipomyces doorenjongii]
MDAVERMAIEEPMCAKTLAPSREYYLDVECWKAFGFLYLRHLTEHYYNVQVITLTFIKVSNYYWDERRGYKVYKRIEYNYQLTDPSGKIWHL